MVIFTQFKESLKKMCSSTKFIDFFVNDLLDYTVLNNAEANFTKNIDLFNIE
jgi:hypothetical protein